MTKKQYRLRCKKRYCQRKRRSKRLEQSYEDRIKYSEHRIFMIGTTMTAMYVAAVLRSDYVHVIHCLH